ncbi:MAG TPA: hypothetical protein VGJ20_20690 [Xanthobacteraceae bacterium]|jgi:hypothetical protein
MICPRHLAQARCRLGALSAGSDLEIDKQYLNSEGMTEIGFLDPEASRTYLTSRRDTVGELGAQHRTLTAK